jgi:hypothetical protein
MYLEPSQLYRLSQEKSIPKCSIVKIINKHSAKNTLKTIKYYESANWATISSRERLIQVSAEVVAEPVRKKKKQLSKVDTKKCSKLPKEKETIVK